jgi:hypothetical protein
LKYRFTKDIIKRIEEIKWWDWSHKELHKRLDDLKDIKKFVYKYSK